MQSKCAQRALQRPLSAGARLDHEPDRHALGVDRLDAEHVRFGENHARPLRVGTQLVRCLKDVLAGGVEIGIDGDIDVDDCHRPQLRLVAHPSHFTVGHVPHRAVCAAHDGGAQ